VALKMTRARLAGTLVAALAVGVSTLAMNGPAQGLNLNKIGGLDPATGFPTHYTDDFGVSLAPCVDGSAACGGATALDDGAGGPGLAVSPDGEGFYWIATSTVNSARGSIDVEFAHEGAWGSATQPIVFDRTRIRGNLRPGSYTLLTPYGRTRFAAEGTGQRNVNLTQDPTCALAPGTNQRCSGKMTNWLRAKGAPLGYLGNGVARTEVTGGPVRNNLVLLANNGKAIGRTSRFVITGKLVEGRPTAVLSTMKVEFGKTAKVVKRTVRLKNQGTSRLTLQGVTLKGAKTLKLTRNGCVTRPSLGPGKNCRINITYRPTLKRPSAATLLIDDDTIAGIHRVPVRAKAPR
jgi:hypothetical protein